MNLRHKRQTLAFAIEGLNSFGTGLYFTYLYFLLHYRFGYSDQANLAVAALLGLCYAVVCWPAGRLARRWGYFSALKFGFGVMAAGLIAGAQPGSAAGQMAAAVVVTFGMCFTWPVLEALASESSAPGRVPQTVGIYNITWSATNAGALFIGGTLVEKFGYASIFYLPSALLAGQMALTFWLEKLPASVGAENKSSLPAAGLPPPALARNFQRLAWVANPFAYLAINTLIAVLPGVAAKFQLTPMFAGFACSLWGFARLGAFVLLWRWDGWHYCFRWLVTAYGALVLAFAAILIVPSLAVLIGAQVVFGAAIGLVYYSSLFYSMDASDTKSEHGGIHEAAIGVGNCVGPAVGVTALQFAAQSPNAGAWAVSGLLLVGLGALVWLRKAAN